MQTIVEPFNFVFVFYVKTPVIDKLFIRSTLTSLRNLIHFRFRGLSLTQLKNAFAYWWQLRYIGTCVSIVFSYFSL